MSHLSSVFADIAERFADRVALRDDKGALSYSEFVEALFRFGSGLKVAAGLAEGDRVALLLPDVREYLIADYGIMCAGLVRVPLDPRLGKEELAAQITLSEARSVITDVAGAERLSHAMPGHELRVVSINGADTDELAFCNVIAAGRADRLKGGKGTDLAALNFSGGSTGRPKATMIPHRTFVAVMNAVPTGFDIGPDDVFLNIRPLWPIAQVVAMAYFGAGATVVLGGKYRAETFADMVRQWGATRSSLVPTQLVRLLDNIERDDARLSALTAIHVGGSYVSPTTFQRALDLLGPRIGILYGLTEAPVTTYLAPGDFAAARTPAEVARLIRSSGRVLQGYDVRLGKGGSVGDSGLGASGEVLIRGANVMDGYLKEPDLTAAALKDGWLHTNDLGAFDDEGRLYIVGRLKEVIRSGASSILPKEVEDSLARNPDLSDVAVIGLPDEEWGEIVAVFAVRAQGSAVCEREVIDSCDPSLARFKRPKRVCFVDEIPRSHYGKVLRPQLLAKLGKAAKSSA